jgi:hypothetical protein
MYTGVAAYLEFCGLRLRDMCFVAVPVGVWLDFNTFHSVILAMNYVYNLMMTQMCRNM